MFDRITAEVRTILATADVEARALGASSIGPEHLLLGLIQVDAPIAPVLRACGLDPPPMRRFLTTEEPTTRALPFSWNARQCLDRSLREAVQRGDSYIGAEHVLFACLDDEGGTVAAVLDAVGASPAAVRVTVELYIARPGANDDEAAAARMLAETFGAVAVEHHGVG